MSKKRAAMAFAPPELGPVSPLQRFMPYAFLAAAVFAVYSNIFNNAFVFDDDLLIRINDYLRSWANFGKLLTASTTEGAHIAGGFYRPIQNILYLIVFQLGGGGVFGFHFLNVALHAANACLGYRLALRLKFNPNAALLGILVWALHPLHTEAITYMSGTADPLFVFFGLVSLNVLFPEATAKRVFLSLPFLILALLSKENAVVFPGLAVLCLYLRDGKLMPIKKYLVTWPLWVVAISYLGWRVTSTGFDGPERYAVLLKMPAYATLNYYATHITVRMLTFLATLPAYAKLLVWPSDLYMERTFPVFDDPIKWPVLEGLLMVALAGVQIAWNRRPCAKPLNWGLLWFAAAHAPDTGILFPMNSLFLEHWMYLPTMGLFLGLAEATVPWASRVQKPAGRAALFGVAALLVAALSARTYDQNRIWSDPVIFYNNIFAHGVPSSRAHNNLAIAYMNRNDVAKAIEEYRMAIREGDTYAETHYNLAIALLSQPPNEDAHIPEAIAELQRSLEIEPGFYRSYMGLAELYGKTGDTRKAAEYRQKGQELMKR